VVKKISVPIGPYVITACLLAIVGLMYLIRCQNRIIQQLELRINVLELEDMMGYRFPERWNWTEPDQGEEL
jgi:hypothetical protein